MFQVGDRIVYGNSGVCTVAAIEPMDRGGKDYYTLQPFFGSEVIYIPVDTQIFMRPALTREEAEELIAQIPCIESEHCADKNFVTMKEHYEKSFNSHECEDLVQLIKGIYDKGQRGKLGVVDQRYMKRAEDLLYGELAVALEIEREEVLPYIQHVVEEQDAGETGLQA